MLNNRICQSKINDVGKMKETELQYKKQRVIKQGKDEIVDNKIFRNKNYKMT